MITHCQNETVGKMRIRRRDTRLWFVGLSVFFAVFLFTFLRQSFKNTDEVEAANLANFDPGYIISDYQMGNYSSMTEAEIQAFLTVKNPCDKKDETLYKQLTAGSVYKWHFENGHFVCLSEELFGDGEVIGEGETAAHIIWQAAQDYKINPQVLIVLLQKETGLITDKIPNNGDYRKATGYGCPDTAPCAAEYYGFKNQVRKAAALFHTVLTGGWTNYPLGNNYIQYNPSAACGGSVVNVRNLATSALYRYTPYQPNEGALAAGYGTAYCGSYGNRNFYHYFEDWFGGITLEDGWKEMLNARTMTVVEDTNALNPLNGDIDEEKLKKGEKYYFNSKVDIVIDGKKEACLRAEEDTKNNVNKCVPISKLTDATIVTYEIEKIEPIKLSVVKDTFKYDLKTGKKVQDITTALYSEISFSGKTKYNGVEYYQTTYDSKNGNEYFIPAEVLSGVMFAKFLYPRNLEVNKNTDFINLETGEICKSVKAGYVKKFTTKVTMNGKVYYRTEEDTKDASMCGILAEDTRETTAWKEMKANQISFADFVFPRELKIKKFSYLTNLIDGTSCEKGYAAGEVIKFTTKITVNGKTYYRSEEGTAEKSTCAVLSTNASEV